MGNKLKLLYALLTLSLLSVFASPATAQVSVSIHADIRIGCLTVNGLVRNAHDVRNMMQVLNNSEDIWHNRNGCTLNTPEVASYTFVGWYNTGDFLIAISAIHLANVQEEPEVESTCRFLCIRTTRAQDQTLFRPVYIVPVAQAGSVFPPHCARSRARVAGVTLMGVNHPDCLPPV